MSGKKVVPPGGGTSKLASSFLDACCDRKSLPTTVHVRPSNINCNSLRSGHTMYAPLVLVGNWNEQRTYDGVNSVDQSIKPKGMNYNKVESVHHDKSCPPAMVGVEPRFMTESRTMSKWLPPPQAILPDVDKICDTLGKPLNADVDPNLYRTSASYLGENEKVRFH